jgi:hypothetical protein
VLRERCEFVKARERFAQQFRAERGESREQLRRGFVSANRRRALQVDRARVESLVNLHRRHARLRLAAHDCPVDRSRAPVFRQQREVYVETTATRRDEK